MGIIIHKSKYTIQCDECKVHKDISQKGLWLIIRKNRDIYKMICPECSDKWLNK